MSNFMNLLKRSEKACKVWEKELEAIGQISFASEHLELVIAEGQKSGIFASDAQRKKDFLTSIFAIVRCALHYYIHAKNGGFDDARVFLRKSMECTVVAIAIGYDMNLYENWKNEKFKLNGCSYLCKAVLKSSSIPDEDKRIVSWIIGQHERSDEIHQYHFLSNESVHGLSCEALRKQLNLDGTFKVDISVVHDPNVLRRKLQSITSILLTTSSIVLGVFEYNEYISRTGVTKFAEKISDQHKKLLEICKDDEL